MHCKIFASSTVVLLLMTGAAQAHIKCDGEYQVVEGREIFTPYCGDNNVARTARADGVRVSNAEIRNDPATKTAVCRMLRDPELKPAC